MYQVITTKQFEKDIKAYRKKFRNVAEDVNKVVETIKEGNLVGDTIPNLKMLDDNENVINVKKVRVSNTDTKSGKSNGYRLIYYAEKSNGLVFLLTIYYKKEKSNISNKEIQQLILKYCC